MLRRLLRKRDSDDDVVQRAGSAFLAERKRVGDELEHTPAKAASPDLTDMYQRINGESGRESTPQIGTSHLSITVLPRLLAVEVLLAEPEALQDDCLESCLYMLRDRLRGAGKS
jgi:hypothetical protein